MVKNFTLYGHDFTIDYHPQFKNELSKKMVTICGEIITCKNCNCVIITCMDDNQATSKDYIINNIHNGSYIIIIHNKKEMHINKFKKLTCDDFIVNNILI